MEPQNNLQALWNREAETVWSVLPPDLLQSVPVSLVLYQPGHGNGEAVYLANKGVIRFPAGNQLQNAVLPGSDHAWKSQKVTVDETSVRNYRSLVHRNERKQIMEADRQRYQDNEYFDTADPSIREDVELVLQTVVPSPLWHGAWHWWRRLPRLGTAYAIHKALLTFVDDDEDAAERVLFVSAMMLGDRALKTRLDLLIFDRRVVPVKDNPELREIANTVCLEGSFDPDLALCLVMRLALSHHLFFPQSARFLHILRVLEIDPNNILTLHGWPPVGQPSANEDIDRDELTQYCEELSSDLHFLIEAAVRWDAGTPTRYAAHRPSGKDVRSRVSALMYRAIALLAGDVAGFKYRARVDESPDTRVIEPPEALRKIVTGGLSVVGLSAAFLKSTGRHDQRETWPIEILQSMGTGQRARNPNLRAGGHKRFPLLNFRAVIEQEDELADKRKWELTYLRARSAIFDKEHDREDQEQPVSVATRK